MRPPWTPEELRRAIPPLRDEIERVERERPDVRALPPMTKPESRDLILSLFQLALSRPLNIAEVFLCGQALCCFEQAVRAEVLGKPGRWIVMSEEEIKEVLKMGEK